MKSYQSSFVVTDQITDAILHKVAHEMWSKELMSKFKKKYTAKWAMAQGVAMYHFRPEDKQDDSIVT
jgi:hypothetical protein